MRSAPPPRKSARVGGWGALASAGGGTFCVGGWMALASAVGGHARGPGRSWEGGVSVGGGDARVGGRGVRSPVDLIRRRPLPLPFSSSSSSSSATVQSSISSVSAIGGREGLKSDDSSSRSLGSAASLEGPRKQRQKQRRRQKTTIHLDPYDDG
jgi:hypothetical protein